MNAFFETFLLHRKIQGNEEFLELWWQLYTYVTSSLGLWKF